jgi:rare lipoprotein A
MFTIPLRSPVSLAVLFAVMLALNACAETQFLISTAKRLDQGAPAGVYKIGSPYQVGGVWYYPKVDYSYDKTGIASWYGPNFHNRRTANGEIFDMNAISAAHKTLPLPSFVTVTNLENGRRLNVRVNDRGPYVHDRIIDLSRRAAQLLGFRGKGTARVRVRIMAKESRALAARIKGKSQLASVGTPITVTSLPKPKVSTKALPPPPGSSTVQDRSAQAARPQPARTAAIATTRWVLPRLGVIRKVAARKTRLYVQAGAFSRYENANKVRARLNRLGPVRVSPVLVNGRDLFRVRVGPMASVAESDKMLEWVIQLGYPNSRIVVD